MENSIVTGHTQLCDPLYDGTHTQLSDFKISLLHNNHPSGVSNTAKKYKYYVCSNEEHAGAGEVCQPPLKHYRGGLAPPIFLKGSSSAALLL